jgi:hypothetical protein
MTVEEHTVMETLATIMQHPLAAIGVAGFIVLQVYQLSRWAEMQADLAWWRSPVEEAAAVYLRATGKDVTRLGPHDIDQIAAAAGCRDEVAAACLRDLRRRNRLTAH